MPFGIDDTTFWDAAALDREMRRVFGICHGCRLCWNLCPSFPALFERVDGKDGRIAALSAKDMRAVVDLCYQCKLCYVKCPYVPPHEFALDFPRLMLRAKAVRVRSEGVSLQDRVLGRPELLGTIGSAAAPLSNWIPRLPGARRLMALAGINRYRLLPRFSRRTFPKWFRSHVPQGDGRNGKVAFFSTCYVDYNAPETGIAAVRVLERNNVRVTLPPRVCCGMPLLDGGDLDAAMAKARTNTDTLSRAVEEGYQIVVPGPTCSYMLKREYPELLGTDAARTVAANTLDLSEYLMRLHKAGKLDTGFSRRLGTVAYHFPCHLKAQNMGYKSRDLMALVPGAEVRVIERCSGMDGTWGLKDEYFHISLRIGSALFSAVTDAVGEGRPAAGLVASDCPLAALQIENGTRMRPLHPVEVLERAYGLDDGART